jgi:hypothetical protein
MVAASGGERGRGVTDSLHVKVRKERLSWFSFRKKLSPAEIR